MPRTRIEDGEIEYETRGAEGAPAFVLIRGLSTQLIHWPDCFLDQIADAGFRVVVFDNRDCGLSRKFDRAGTPAIGALLRGEVDPPYQVADMARDAVGVIDALGIERAHVAGISMGGMIVQHLAFSHADRLLTAASVMSSSGDPELPSGTPEAMAALTARPSDPNDREIVIEHNMRTQRVIQSPKYPPSESELRSYFERGYDRSHCPDGTARQMAAVLADGSRVDRLETIDLPFLVLHGSDDPLIPLACGVDTARHVRGARLETISGMGHDITEANSPLVTRILIDHARQGATR